MNDEVIGHEEEALFDRTDCRDSEASGSAALSTPRTSASRGLTRALRHGRNPSCPTKRSASAPLRLPLLSTSTRPSCGTCSDRKCALSPATKGTAEVRLAMERGEVTGSCGDNWASLKSTAADLLQARKILIPVQFAVKKHPELGDVPLVLDIAKTEEEKAALRICLARNHRGGRTPRRPTCPQISLPRSGRVSTRPWAIVTSLSSHARLGSTCSP